MRDDLTGVGTMPFDPQHPFGGVLNVPKNVLDLVTLLHKTLDEVIDSAATNGTLDSLLIEVYSEISSFAQWQMHAIDDGYYTKLDRNKVRENIIKEMHRMDVLVGRSARKHPILSLVKELPKGE
jgi:hypothetical protein